MSAHEETILAVTAALNLINTTCMTEIYFDDTKKDEYPLCYYPSFASNIRFELYDADEDNDK